MTTRRRNPCAAALVISAAIAALPRFAVATNVDHYFVGPTNSLFSNAANWSLSPNGPGGSPPADQDNATINPSSPLSLTVDYLPGTNATSSIKLNNLTFTGSAAAPITATQTGPVYANHLLVGPYSALSFGDPIPGARYGPGGTYTTLDVDGASASLALTSASDYVSPYTFSVGSTFGGTLSMSNGNLGGTSGLAHLGGLGPATASISGGSFTFTHTFLDSAVSSSLAQSGGNVAGVSSTVHVGRNASYSLSGGTVASVYVGDPDTYHSFSVPADAGATFNQTGGTVTRTVVVNSTTPASPAGFYSLSGTGLLKSSGAIVYIGATRAGTFAQSGGTVGGGPSAAPGITYSGDPSRIFIAGSFQSDLTSPSSSGSYSLSGTGQLATNLLDVGYAGHGTFAQSAGSVTLRGKNPALSLGTQAGATGTYSLSAGSLSFVPYGSGTFPPALLAVGNGGSGTFVQTGGTVSLPTSAELRLGNAAGATGSYSLSGAASLAFGTNAAIEVGYSGRGSFAQSGGSLSAAAVSVGYNAGATGTYTLSAGTLSVSLFEAGYSGTGTLSVSGGVAAFDTLSLADISNSAGHLSLTGGTLSTTSLTAATNGTATVTHSAGSLTVAQTLTLASSYSSSASYSLSGTASLHAGSLVVGADPGSPASFAQTGGSVSLSSLRLPSSGAGIPHAYSLSAGSLTASAFTYSGTFSQSGGTSSFSSVNGGGTITLSGTASFSANLLGGGTLSLSGSALATLRPSPVPSFVSSLTLANASTLDLTTDTLQITYASTSPVDTIRSYLLTGNLTSSSADPTRRLAYSDASSTLTIRLALTGDANLNGHLDADDYALLDRAYAKSTTNAHWTDGDFDYDGVVTSADYLLIDTAYAQSHPLSPSLLSQRESQFGADYVAQLFTSIPEPSSLACLLAPSLLLTRRRTKS